ncbi:hypothetical protein [Mycobacterium sp.]|nr:hypothetical protein [Mycobacterium sp.]HME48753.1 hypothetical protein [Mycobacterium sp.]
MDAFGWLLVALWVLAAIALAGLILTMVTGPRTSDSPPQVQDANDEPA